nr:patatin-like phospholipase family protein [Ardenticatena sp.]
MLAFVLSGGGNRGALQVGALQILLEAGIVPDMVVGTSVGAVNAAFLAVDPTPRGAYRLADIWRRVRKDDLYPGTHLTALWNTIRGREGLFSNANWFAFLQKHTPVKRFGHLRIPAYVVATDLETGRQVVFGDNPDDPIVDALMASTALPPLHPPWVYEGRRLIDGGAVADLPVRVAIDRGATEIIALNLANPHTPGEQLRSLVGIVNRAVSVLVWRHVEADLEHAALLGNVRLRTIDLRVEMTLAPWDFSQTSRLIAEGREMTRRTLEADPYCPSVPPQRWRDRLAEAVSSKTAGVLRKAAIWLRRSAPSSAETRNVQL